MGVRIGVSGDVQGLPQPMKSFIGAQKPESAPPNSHLGRAASLQSELWRQKVEHKYLFLGPCAHA